jgi:hypothetical protein
MLLSRSYSYGEAGRATAEAEAQGVTEEARRYQHGARGQVELPASGARKSTTGVGVLADGQESVRQSRVKVDVELARP